MNENFLNPVRSQGDFEQVQKKQTSNGVKLTNTVYKILEFFPESDPLKNRAKDKALTIMEHLILLNETSGWASFQKEKNKAQLLEDIDVLLGYLWIGKSQGWLNSVNCLIIANEYEKIRKEIAPIIMPIIEPTQKLPGIDLYPTIKTEEKVEEKNIQELIDDKKEDFSSQDVKEGYGEITARQEKIIEFLSKNEKAQVMDLQTILPDITKRTIRRDLDELLQLGKIVRLGDFNQVFYKINKEFTDVGRL